MAVRDFYIVLTADPADNAEVTVQPAGTVEAVIHALEWGTGGTDPTQIEVYRCHAGGDDLIMDGDEYPALNFPQGYVGGLELYVNNSYYLKIKNVAGDAKTFIAALGMTTHA